MTDEVIYDQIEQGDPDPLGLRKKAAGQKTKADPLGLRKTAVQPKEAQPAAFQIQLSMPGQSSQPMTQEQGTVYQESGTRTNVKSKDFSFDKPVDVLGVEKMRGKAAVAHEKLKSELLANDSQYEKNIREYRRDNYTVEDLRRDYERQGMILSPQDEQKLLQKERQRRYDLPVSKEDISDIKTGTILDESSTRKFIKNTKRNDLMQDLYTVDKFNEISNDPNGNYRVEKVKDIAKKIGKGELLYDPESKRAVKPLGLLGSIIEGTVNKFKGEEEHDFFKNAPDASIIKELEDERNNPDTDEPLKVPKGKAQEVLMSMAEMPLSPLAAGAIGSLAGPQAGLAASALVGAYENRKVQYRATFKQVYNELRDQGVSENEALQKARRQAELAQEIGTLVGAGQGYLGAKIGTTPLRGASFSPGYQKAIGSFLKQNGSEFGKMALEGAAQGGVGALGEVWKNKLAQSIGIKRDLDEGTADQFWGNLFMTVGIGAAIKAGRGLTKANYKTILHGISKIPDEEINGLLQEKVANGELTQAAADETSHRINEYKQKDLQIPSNVTEEARFKIQDNIDKINELEAQKEATHKSLQEPIKEKITKLEDENLALLKETEKPVKPESGLSKSREKEAIETAEEFVAEGILPDVYNEMVKKDPIGFWKMVAQQAQNMDENWKPLKEQLGEQSVRDQFGDTVVDYAIELFPAPESKVIDPVTQIETDRAADINEIESSDKLTPVEKKKQIDDTNAYYDRQKQALVAESTSTGASVIMPGEIKQLEAITIKPKENAVSVEKPDAVDVRQQAGDGEALVTRDIQPEISAGEEGQQRSTEEGTSTGKEGQVSEPEMVGITHAQMDKVSRELGLPEYTKDPGTFEGWTREAKARLAKDPDSMNKLINRLRNGDIPDAVETQMMKMHFAALKDRYNKNPTPELLNEINRTKDLYNIAGREEGKRLVARRGLIPEEDTLADFHLRDVEFNKGARLTEEQLAQSTKEYNEIKAVKDALEQKVQKLEADAAKVKAEKVIRQELKAAKKDAKKDYKAERAQIIKDIAEKWKKSSKESLGASVLPFAKELAAIAPDVMKLVRNVVEEGVIELGDVIKSVHAQVKDVLPGISEKNVHDIIAGEYTKKQTRNQLATTLYELKKEAQLMNELDQLLSGAVPTNQKKLRNRNQKIEALRQQIKELKDDMGLNERTMEEKLASLKGRYKTKIKELEKKIADGDFGPDEKPEPIQLDKEGQALRDEYLRLKEEREIRLLEQEYGNRGVAEKVGTEISRAIKTGRTLQSSFDVSYPFRQTIVGLSRQLFALPFKKRNGKWEYTAFEQQKQLKDQFAKMYQAFGSERMFRRIMDDIHTNPDYEKWQKAGLDLTEPVSALETAKEEMFQSSYAEKIPGVKMGVKASHRAATTIANKMKWDIVNQLAEKFQDQGKTFENSPELYEATARYANQLIGRGVLGQKMENAAPIIAHFVYSLRLYASRLQLLTYLANPRFYTKVPKEIRVEYLKDMTKFVALGGTVMGLAAASGLKVGLNPFGSDFGSIVAGDTRYDIWGGFKQYAVLLSRLFAGKTMSTSGEVKDLRPLFTEDDGDYKEKTRGDVLLRFLRTKASPELSTTINIITGKGFDNKPVTVKSAALDYFTPLIYKDIQESLKDGGVDNALLNFLLASHGVGVQTYGSDEKKTSSPRGGKPSKNTKATKQSKD